MKQSLLGFGVEQWEVRPFKRQLLKWVGNKQRFAHEIVACFPPRFGRYLEPFLGSGAVLATLRPDDALATDCFEPLVEIWTALKEAPDELIHWYTERWQAAMSGDRKDGYNRVRDSFNRAPNGADLVYLSRACYGGVVRFRKLDGYMSTPCGPHTPVSPESFAGRVREWAERTSGATFACMDFRAAMSTAESGDLVYCDPPYTDTQKILYGAQEFDLRDLFSEIAECKARGVNVLLSIDGSKKSGRQQCRIPMPKGLFEREIEVNCGRSMLRRFQMQGETLEDEVVSDRLLLTY